MSEGWKLKFLIAMAMVCGRKRAEVVEQGDHWFSINEVMGTERD
jgi:hypothetical protein